MKRTFYAALAALVVCGAAPAMTWADVPSTITVQGRLTDDTGTAVAAGTKTFTFRIYDAESGGSFVWEEVVGVDTDEGGLWTAHLGSFNPLDPSVFEATERWLEITVNDGVNPPETLSRVKLDCSPFGFRSAVADVADSAVTVVDNAITSAKIEDATIELGDIAQNGAAYDDVLRWNGGGWVAAPETGDISEVVAGAGLYGGATDGSAPLSIGAGAGINVGADAISLDVGGLAGDGLDASGTALNVGAGPGITIDATTVGFDASSVAGVGLQATGAVLNVDDARYVNEGQPSAINSNMIANGTVTAEDLLDEPGQATTYCDTINHLTSTIEDIMSKSILCPTNGWVMVIASVTIRGNKAVSVDQDAELGVSNSPTAIQPAHQMLIFGLSGGYTGSNYIPVTLHGVYPVTSGYRTFYLLGRETSGDVMTVNGQMTLLFIPSSY